MASPGVAAGMLNVEQISQVDSNVALVTLTLGMGTFRVGTGGNRGDYSVLIGPGTSAAQDESLGVLMSCVTENGRDNFGTNGYPTSSIETNGSGTYRIVSFLGAGGGAGSANEYNVNVAGAWFPYDRYPRRFRAQRGRHKRWHERHASPARRGWCWARISRVCPAGNQSLICGASALIRALTGVLLVNHAKDENNYALSQVNTIGWHLECVCPGHRPTHLRQL